MLRLIDERSAAFRAAVTAAPGLELRVPTCPEWTLLDLARHLGGVHRRWAAIVSAGPADAPPDKSDSQVAGTAPQQREALLAWSAASTQQLLDALREAGPDRGCWTWWGESQSPQTTGAVARHQVQEVTVHTYDAQNTVGAPEPLPDEAALDGVDEFMSTCSSGPYPWPYAPAAVEFHAAEGGSWHLSLGADGVLATRLSAPGQGLEAADASARGTAAELVLVLYGRLPLDTWKIDGDRRQFELLRDWDPDA